MNDSNARYSTNVQAQSRLKALFLTSGLFFDPDSKGVIEKFRYLSKHIDGFVLGAVYKRQQKYCRLDAFEAHSIYLIPMFRGYRVVSRLLRLVLFSIYVVMKSLKIHFINRQKIDVVIACDPFKTGSYGWLISRLTGAALVVELNGNYVAAFQLEGDDIESSRAKHRLVLWLIGKIIPRADGLKLLYPTQLDGLVSPSFTDRIQFLNIDQLSAAEESVAGSLPCALSMHNLVPLQNVLREDNHTPYSGDPYVLLLGHPWYLKGVDLLINAFLRLRDEFPKLHLKIIGYCEDPSMFQALAGTDERIELYPTGVPHAEALRIIGDCHVYVLASRTEAMGRVLLEAMAAERPIVAADVDGVPQIIQNNDNGLLFEPGSVDALASALRRILSDADLRGRLAGNGLRDVTNKFSEEKYAKCYAEFMRLVTSRA